MVNSEKLQKNLLERCYRAICFTNLVVTVLLLLSCSIIKAQEVKTYHALSIGAYDFSIVNPLKNGDTIFDFVKFGYKPSSLSQNRIDRIAKTITNIAYPDRKDGLDLIIVSGFGNTENANKVFDKLPKNRNYSIAVSEQSNEEYSNAAIIYNSKTVTLLSSNTFHFYINLSNNVAQRASIFQNNIITGKDTFSIFSFFMPYNIYNDTIRNLVINKYKNKQMEIIDAMLTASPSAKFIIINNNTPPYHLPLETVFKDNISGKIKTYIIKEKNNKQTRLTKDMSKYYLAYNTAKRADNTNFSHPKIGETPKRNFESIFASEIFFTGGIGKFRPFKFYAVDENEISIYLKKYKETFNPKYDSEIPLCKDCSDRHPSYLILIKEISENK